MSMQKCIDQYRLVTRNVLSSDNLEQFKIQYQTIVNRERKNGGNPYRLVDITEDGKTIQKTWIEVEFKKSVTDNAVKQKALLTINSLKGHTILDDVDRKVLNMYHTLLELNPTPLRKWHMGSRFTKAEHEAKLRFRARVASVMTTNDTRGHNPLDMMLHGERHTIMGEFMDDLHRALDDITGNEPMKFIRDRQKHRPIMLEIYNIRDNKGVIGKSITNDPEAFKVAKSIWTKTILEPKTILEELGRPLRNVQMLFGVMWNHKKVANYTRERFVTVITKNLNPATHGDVTQRSVLANKMFDDITNEKLNWREIGADASEIVEGPFVERNQIVDHTNRKKFLDWTDGDSQMEVTKLFTDESGLHHQILSHITEMSRQIALTRFLGADHKLGFSQWKGRIEADNYTKNLSGFERKQHDAMIGWVETVINPQMFENQGVFFSIARNLQAGKLGMATITATLDVPNFMVLGNRTFGMKTGNMLKQLFGMEGWDGATVASKRNFARYVGEFYESFQDAAVARFNLNDSFQAPGLAGRGAAMWAHYVFKFSGLNWWTRSLQAGAAGVYQLELGTLIKSRTAWATLSTPFRNQLIKFGISPDDWATVLNRYHGKKGDPKMIDHRDRLNLYELERKPNGDLYNAMGDTPIRKKFISAVTDAVDTMVIKPSKFDLLATSFFNQPSSLSGNMWRVVTQFKAHPITFMRKSMWRLVAKNPDLDFRIPEQADINTYRKMGFSANEAMDFANLKNPIIANRRKIKDITSDVMYLASTMMVTSAVVVQLKEFVKGNQPYKMTGEGSMEFWLRTIQTAGVMGLVSDLYFLTGGRELMKMLYSDEKIKMMEPNEYWGMFMGPLIQDIASLLSITLKGAEGIRREIKGLDKGELKNKQLSNLSKLLIHATGYENLILTALLSRLFGAEQISQMLDPKGFRRKKKKAKKKAQEERYNMFNSGKEHNFIYEALQD